MIKELMQKNQEMMQDITLLKQRIGKMESTYFE